MMEGVGSTTCVVEGMWGITCEVEGVWGTTCVVEGALGHQKDAASFLGSVPRLCLWRDIVVRCSDDCPGLVRCRRGRENWAEDWKLVSSRST